MAVPGLDPGIVPAIHAGRRRVWLQKVNEGWRGGRFQTINGLCLPDGVDGRDMPGHDGAGLGFALKLSLAA
jgi:hypothetical protein